VTSTRDVVRASLQTGAAEVAIPASRLPDDHDIVALAFDAPGAEVLLADARGQCVASYPLDPVSGQPRLDAGRLLLSLDSSELGPSATPAGLAVDAKGNVYCSLADGRMVCLNLKAPQTKTIPVFEPPEDLPADRYVASGVFLYTRPGKHWHGGRQANGCIGITLHARGQPGQDTADKSYAAWDTRVVTVAEGVPSCPPARLLLA